MSASSYVSLAPTEATRLPNERSDFYQRVPIMSPRNCRHMYTVCLICMDTWAEDYLSRGGRAQGQPHHTVLEFFLTREGYDTVSSVSRQYFIDTGQYLKLGEADIFAPVKDGFGS